MGENVHNKPDEKKASEDPYECDTDEEIGQIKSASNDKMSKDNCSPNVNNVDNDTVEKNKTTNYQQGQQSSTTYDKQDDTDDAYDADTDIDDDEIENLRPNTENLDLDTLPKYFKNQVFHLHKVKHDKEIRRYIVAYGGRVEEYMTDSVQIIITSSVWSKHFEEARNVNKEVEFVRP